MRVADFNQWNERYTPETRTAQIKLARLARLRILALEAWGPGGLLLAGLFFLGLFIFQRQKTVPPIAEVGTSSPVKHP
jgi:hypothetical protein